MYDESSAVLPGRHRPVQRAHDAGGHGGAQAERSADRDDGLADAQGPGPAERGGLEVLGAGDVEDGEVVDGTAPDDGRVLPVAVLVDDLDRTVVLGRVGDDVVVGDDVALVVEHEARPGRTRLDPLELGDDLHGAGQHLLRDPGDGSRASPAAAASSGRSSRRRSATPTPGVVGGSSSHSRVADGSEDATDGPDDEREQRRRAATPSRTAGRAPRGARLGAGGDGASTWVGGGGGYAAGGPAGGGEAGAAGAATQRGGRGQRALAGRRPALLGRRLTTDRLGLLRLGRPGLRRHVGVVVGSVVHGPIIADGHNRDVMRPRCYGRSCSTHAGTVVPGCAAPPSGPIVRPGGTTRAGASLPGALARRAVAHRRGLDPRGRGPTVVGRDRSPGRTRARARRPSPHRARRRRGPPYRRRGGPRRCAARRRGTARRASG